MSAPVLLQYNDGKELSAQLAFLSNLTAGNFLLCAFSGGGVLAEPTDTLNNSWFRLPNPVSGNPSAGIPDLTVSYCPITLGGACTVKGPGSGTTFLAIAEFSPSAIVDFTQIAQGSATSAQIAGAVNQLLVGYAAGNSSGTITGAGAGFTFEQVNASSQMAMEYQALSGSGNVNSDFTGTAANIATGALILATPNTSVAGTPSVVQSSNKPVSQSYGCTLSFSNAVQAGDFLLVLVSTLTTTSSSVPSPSISDNLGNNNWTVLATSFLDSSGVYTSQTVWYCENSKGGSLTVTISNLSSSVYATSAQGMECTPSAVAAFSPMATGATSAANVMSASIAGQSGQLLVGYGSSRGVGAGIFSSAVAPFVPLTYANGAFELLIFETQPLVSSGNYTSNFTTTADGGSFNSAYSTGVLALFTAYVISGNAGLAFATVSYSGDASGSVTADVSGNYSIPGLLAGNYTITPSRTGWTFSPPSANVTITTSNISGVNFTATQIQVATPTISPVAGSYSGPVTVTISCATDGASIFYTLDGDFGDSQLYTGPFVINPPLTVEAIGVLAFFETSLVASATYTVPPGKPSPIPLPFSKRTTAATAFFRCVQIASANGVQWYVNTTAIQRGQLSTLWPEMLKTYDSLIHQDRRHQTVKLDRLIATALAQATSVNSIVQAITPGTASGQAATLQTMQQVCAQAVQQILNAKNFPDDGE